MTEREYKERIDAALAVSLDELKKEPQHELGEAMAYSLLAGGKRIRPMLVLEFCRVSGGEWEKALPIACGIEMLHTYSLIHDDLPCMDNDELRRGRPTNHVVYGECTATLAGDALQAEAFRSVLSAALPADRLARCAAILAEAAGALGMCGGQYLDMEGEGRILSVQELTDINSRKTGALLAAACKMGVAAAGGSPAQLLAAEHYGAAVGAAFQIRDDMLDVLSTAEELGKPIGSDQAEQKNTYMVLLGEEGCREAVEHLSEEAAEVLSGVFEDCAFLSDLARSLAVRQN